MCRRNIRESLTARIFLLTLLLLLGAGGLTFGLIAWATPITYVSVVGDRLQVQVSELTDRLALTKLADAGPILDVFVRESGAAVSLASPDGESVDTGSLYVSVTTAVQESDSVSTYTYGADGGPAQRERAGHYVTTALSDALIAEVTFADRAETYQLLVVPPMRLANQAVEALNRAAPCLALALLAFSLLCAVGYSRYLARPIVRISSIAGRMAELDFQWKCGETRRDEIGALGRSLDEMAERLSAALAELEEANAALRGDMERARELLAEAGYPDGFSMTITVPSNYQPHIDTATVLVEQLKAVGITAEIQPVEWGAWLSEVYGNRQFQSTVVGVDASNMTARALLERFTSAADDNFINYQNTDYDALFQQAQATADDAEQTELYKQMERNLTEHAANVYIQDLADLVVLRNGLEGYQFYPIYVMDLSTVHYAQ